MVVRKLLVLVALCFVGVGAWNLGNRLSNDAVSMLVGLVFGSAATMFPLLLVLSAWRKPTRPVEQPPPVVHVVMLPQPATRQLPDARTIDGTCTQYTQARPFALLEVQPQEPVDPEACPDWCEPWIWAELYDNGKSAPPHESLQQRRYRVDWEV